MGGGPGGGGRIAGPEPRDSDDGKRFPAVDVVSALFLGENIEIGRGSRGRGAKNST